MPRGILLPCATLNLPILSRMSRPSLNLLQLTDQTIKPSRLYRSTSIRPNCWPLTFTPTPVILLPKICFTSQSIKMASAKVEEAKALAGKRAVAEHFDEKMTYVGIGSGTTILYVVDEIAHLLSSNQEAKHRIRFVPTGYQSRQSIIAAGLTPIAFDSLPDGVVLDVAFDGADEVDDELNCIKGGGACLFQEKLVAERARKFVCVAGITYKSSNWRLSDLTAFSRLSQTTNPPSHRLAHNSHRSRAHVYSQCPALPLSPWLCQTHRPTWSHAEIGPIENGPRFLHYRCSIPKTSYDSC